jgi:hypothetical protein
MPTKDETVKAREALRRFQAGYTARDLSKLDDFMRLFSPRDEVELIGIGASQRGGNEWFEGLASIREIIESDWTYWGDVTLDVEGARISLQGDVAWLSTTGTLTQTKAFDQALPQYLDQMSQLVSNPDLSPDERLLEATHFGVRRLRERLKGEGHQWPFTITAVLVRSPSGEWLFHTLHWAMPVD